MNYRRVIDALKEVELEPRDESILRSLEAEYNSSNIRSDSPLENELNRLEDKYLANTELYILRSLVPQATVENINFETSSNGKLQVRVIYSISDVVEGDAISQWFDQQEYEKYFRIKTNLWLFVDDNGRSKYDRKISSMEAPALSSSAETAGDLISEKEQVLGSNIVKFKYEKTYELDKEPYGMDFEVITSFDMMQLERDYDVDFVSSQYGTEVRKKLHVLMNGELQYPVQDFRTRKELEKFSLSEERKEAFAWLNLEVEKKREIDRQNSTDFFSDFWLTRNAQGEAKFVFVFDIDSFFEKRSEYKDFYNRMSNAERGQLKRQISVPSLKIKRKRVLITDSSRGKEVVDFDDNYTMTTVVETSKLKNKEGFSKVITETGAIMQINISGTSQKDLIFFTGTDYDVADSTDGLYAYGVSVGIVDTMRDYLLGKIDVLKKEAHALKDILQSSTIRVEDYDASTNLYKKPLKEIAGRNFTATASAMRNLYQLFSRTAINLYSFNPVFKRRMRSIERRDIKNKINNLFKIDKIKSPTELEMLIDVVETMIRNCLSTIGENSSASFGRKTVSTVDKKITSEKFYKRQSMVFDANISRLKGMDYLTTTIDVDSDMVLKEINMLSRDTGTVGVKVIDGATWENRAIEEINKFYPVGTTAINIPGMSESQSGDSSVSLTGTGSEYYTMSFSVQPDKPINFFRGINSDVSDSIKILTENIIDTDNTEEHFLSDFGITFGNSSNNTTLLDLDRGKRDSSSRGAESPDVDFGVNLNNLGMTTEEYIEQRDFEKYIFTKMVEPLNSPGFGTMRIFDSVAGPSPSDRMLAFNLSDSQSVFTRDRQEEVRNAPNQTLSYSLRDSYSPDYVVTENFLTKIEFLSEFNTDDESENVSMPIWEPLTIDTYKENTGKNLLCRIKPQHNKSLGIRTAKTGHPIYDAFFVINPRGNFTYEYTESIAKQNQDATLMVIEAAAQAYQEELQELVGDKHIVDLVMRAEQEEYLRTSLNPRLQIVRERDNYRNVRLWSRYNIEKNEDIQRYTAYLEGFNLTFMLALSEVASGQIKVSEEGGWFSPRNTAQVIEDSTQNLRDSYISKGEQVRALERDIRDLTEEIEEAGYSVKIETIETRPVVTVERK